ncbi:MAG TPA: hypothetical protein VMD59_23535, partial [Acidimicrobiales bacterium]|nr:hypothetical protein [Acidimicrobiales bacterium]
MVIEAAAGYGKSVLAAELVDRWNSIGISVQLEHDGVGASLLAARMHEAVAKVGLTEAAAAIGANLDPTAALEATVAALAEERCTFVVDDAHHARRDAAQLIVHLARSLTPAQRLVVLARQLPDGAARLRRAEYLQLSARDLALDREETVALCRTGFGLDIGPGAAGALEAATGGWTAATVLAVARAARTGEEVAAVVEAVSGPNHPAGALVAILDEALETLGADGASRLAQVARLPLADAEVVAAATGDGELFERGLAAGIPFTPLRGPWWDLPGPVRDHLATLSPVEPDAMRRAAEVYRRRGELGAAVDLLLAMADPFEAAALLAATPPAAEESLDTLELGARFDQLPREAVDAHPEVLLVVARRLGHAGRYAKCCELLARAEEIARANADPLLERAAAAELVKNRLLASFEHRAAEEAARRVLDATGPSEQLTRARASEFLGYALCQQVEQGDIGDPASADEALAEAEDCFGRAARLYRELGMRSATAFVAVDHASLIELPRGQTQAALRRVEEALLLVAGRPRAWAFVMLWRARLAAELGEDDLGRSSAAEVLRVAEQTGSSFLVGQAHWRLAVLASYRGDAEATLDHLRRAESSNQTWWGLSSGEFLAEAADLVDRVGQAVLARDYLARVKAEPKNAGRLVAVAEAALEARHGDPEVAEQLLVELAAGRVERRELWRTNLLRAVAAFRRNDGASAGTLAALAFEEAARLGQPELPLVH